MQESHEIKGDIYAQYGHYLWWVPLSQPRIGPRILDLQANTLPCQGRSQCHQVYVYINTLLLPCGRSRFYSDVVECLPVNPVTWV